MISTSPIHPPLIHGESDVVGHPVDGGQGSAPGGNVGVLERHQSDTSLANSRHSGEWFITFSGKRFWPTDARQEDIDLRDIAHGLSNVCRFGGHCRTFYSVAQHSVLVSELCCADYALTGLLHDATEAYIGDMVRPLKYQIPQFRDIEDRLWKVIAQRYGLPEVIPAEVKYWDNVALMTERRDLIDNSGGHEWSLEKTIKPASVIIDPLPPSVARRRFIERFRELTRP